MINIDKKMKVTEHTGPHLYLDRISRMDMAAYLCIARNGVPPSVSKRIQVSVEFSPMMSIPHQLVGAPLGYSITLECTIEAHPPPLTFWTVKEGAMLHHGRKYDITETPGSVPYRIHMKLTVRNLQREDFGPHKCVAKNSKGETEGLIKLYETQPPTLAPTTPRSYLDKLFQAIHYQTTQSADIYDDEDNNLQQEQGEDQAGDQRQEHEGEESEDEEHSEQNHIRMEGSEEQGRGEKRIHDSRSSTSSSPQRGREDTEARGNREHHFTRLLSRGPTVHQASTTLALHCIGLAVILQYCIRHLL